MVVRCPYTGPNTSIYSIVCTYYLQPPVTEIHPLQNFWVIVGLTKQILLLSLTMVEGEAREGLIKGDAEINLTAASNRVTTLRLLCCFLLEHLKYTESNCIRHVVGGCKMPLYGAKHEYIQHYLYVLSPTSCNGNPPITLSPTRLLCSLKLEIKVHKNMLLAPPPPDSHVCELLMRKIENFGSTQILS